MDEDLLIGVAAGVVAALAVRALALNLGCSCFLRVRLSSPFTVEGRGLIACAYVWSMVYTSALMLGFVAASAAARRCRSCLVAGLLGLYVPRVAGAAMYIGLLYLSPLWFSSHYLVLAAGSSVLRLFSDVYAAYLAYTGADSLAAPRPRKLLEAVVAVAFAYLFSLAVWIVARLFGVEGPVLVACGDARLTPVTVAEAVAYVGFLVFAAIGEAGKRRRG